MKRTQILTSGMLLMAAVVFAAAPASAQCPITGVGFGASDSFSLTPPPDPNPYSLALPEFVNYLNTALGIPTASMKTFDHLTSNRHFVASLRHGLRRCFPGGQLKLCIWARAHNDVPTNDSVTIYNTDFGVWSFPVIYSSVIAPTLIASWTNPTTATLCIDLTTQMNGNQIGDMLQIRIQDDTAVDGISMIYWP